MTPRRQRLLAVGSIIVGVALAAGLILQALEENINHFYSPTEVLAGAADDARSFRLGGLVVDGSFNRSPGDLTAEFIVRDNESNIRVQYTGVLPDLFKEGQGMVATGRLSKQEEGLFIADDVLAKHDENYMSPEVKKMLDEQGHPTDSPATDSPATDSSATDAAAEST